MGCVRVWCRSPRPSSPPRPPQPPPLRGHGQHHFPVCGFGLELGLDDTQATDLKEQGIKLDLAERRAMSMHQVFETVMAAKNDEKASTIQALQAKEKVWPQPVGGDAMHITHHRHWPLAAA